MVRCGYRNRCGACEPASPSALTPVMDYSSRVMWNRKSTESCRSRNRLSGTLCTGMRNQRCSRQRSLHACPEIMQVRARVYAVVENQRVPFGPEELDFRWHAKRREMFLGAQVSGLQVGELELVVFLAQLGIFLGHALFGGGRMPRLQPKLFHLRQNAQHAAQIVAHFLDSRRCNSPSGKVSGSPDDARCAPSGGSTRTSSDGGLRSEWNSCTRENAGNCSSSCSVSRAAGSPSCFPGCKTFATPQNTFPSRSHPSN